MRARRTVFLIVLSLASFVGSVQATTLRKLDTRDLLVHSDLIVVGKVLATESHWVRPPGLIMTDVSVQVSRRAKGELKTERIVVRTPGGRIGDVAQDIDGAPVFQKGQDVLLFLKSTPENGVFAVRGMHQGKVDLVPDATGRLAMQRASIDGKPQRGLPRVLAPSTTVVYVDEFLADPGVVLE
jgi:hypothetical protein